LISSVGVRSYFDECLLSPVCGVCRIEKLELFDEFEEWFMIQVLALPPQNTS
jgi:hypothetical protein